MNAFALTLTVVFCVSAVAQQPKPINPGRLASAGLFFGGAGQNIYGPDIYKERREMAQKLKAQTTSQIAAMHEARNQAASVGADARVVAFLEERIANGSIDARYDLGLRKIQGRGVETNSVAGRKLISEAAQLGHSDATQWLAKNPPPADEKP